MTAMAGRLLSVEAVRGAMERAGLSAAAIAAKLEVSREAVSTWLNGENQPRPDKLLKLSLLLGVRYNELLHPLADDLAPLVAFRKKGNRKVTEQHILHAQIMGEMLRPIIPYLPAWSVMASSTLRQPSRDYNYLQTAVDEIRKEMGVSPTQAIDYGRFIHAFLARQVIMIPVLWGARENHDNALHIFLPDSQTTWVYLNLDSSIYDFKFWMAHELGHILSPSLRGDEAEDFAEDFAANLLFPRAAAEPLYRQLMAQANNRARMGVIRDVAKSLQISAITVYNQANAFARHVGENPLQMEDGLFGMANNLRKEAPTIREILFGKDLPDAETYLKASKEAFGTPFFDALGRYLAESQKSSSLVKEMLDIPLVDAKAVHAALL